MQGAHGGAGGCCWSQPWWHPRTCTALNSPRLSIKGSIFFPRSPQHRLPARDLQSLPRRGLSKFYYSALPPLNQLAPVHPSPTNPLQQPLWGLRGSKKTPGGPARRKEVAVRAAEVGGVPGSTPDPIQLPLHLWASPVSGLWAHGAPEHHAGVQGVAVRASPRGCPKSTPRCPGVGLLLPSARGVPALPGRGHPDPWGGGGRSCRGHPAPSTPPRPRPAGSPLAPQPHSEFVAAPAPLPPPGPAPSGGGLRGPAAPALPPPCPRRAAARRRAAPARHRRLKVKRRRRGKPRCPPQPPTPHPAGPLTVLEVTPAGHGLALWRRWGHGHAAPPLAVTLPQDRPARPQELAASSRSAGEVPRQRGREGGI